jgi:hypothetical protein
MGTGNGKVLRLEETIEENRPRIGSHRPLTSTHERIEWLPSPVKLRCLSMHDALLPSHGIRSLGPRLGPRENARKRHGIPLVRLGRNGNIVDWALNQPASAFPSSCNSIVWPPLAWRAGCAEDATCRRTWTIKTGGDGRPVRSRDTAGGLDTAVGLPAGL